MNRISNTSLPYSPSHREYPAYHHVAPHTQERGTPKACQRRGTRLHPNLLFNPLCHPNSHLPSMVPLAAAPPRRPSRRRNRHLHRPDHLRTRRSATSRRALQNPGLAAPRALQRFSASSASDLVSSASQPYCTAARSRAWWTRAWRRP